MIEVEKKFILTNEQEKALIDGAEFLGGKKFTDIYYDDSNYSLTSKDIWLRSRDNRFELKIPMNVCIEDRVSDQYKEIENDKDILNYFKANIDGSLADFLVKNEFNPFCAITTTRRKYKKSKFNIDLDFMDFGYTITEIEYMTNKELEMEEATRSIIEFAKRHNINSDTVVRGKVVEYLRINNPNHFQKLLRLGIIV
ncbi:CYTH domain-containing protein [Patescibacteria group bacterium]|nr:CYTH domain-containing protein [Patescibacteria group bacterium]